MFCETFDRYLKEYHVHHEVVLKDAYKLNCVEAGLHSIDLCDRELSDVSLELQKTWNILSICLVSFIDEWIAKPK